MRGKKISKDKIRLDLLLVQKGLAESREKAKALIMAGEVEINGVQSDKPGHPVPVSSEISLKKSSLPYVSRGGFKLEAALDHFSVDVEGLTMMDIGASTGGFTDCLLQRGAKKVIAVDVGYGQLHWKLRQDPRVRILEKKNARYLETGDVEEVADGAVVDVSFISLKLIIPPLRSILSENSFVIALIKPQFEVGRHQVGKGGVVRDTLLHDQVIDCLCSFFKDQGWIIEGHIPSPILGPKGNREFLVYLKK